ncbi:MAG: TonB-dependent receptor [Flavipsychrobacter sp.]|nr:TonB-dependent receptor [Flavipsychrobacter sp.]
MTKLAFCVAFLFAFSLDAFASGSIRGRVADDAGKPLTFASVILLHAADSSLVKTELTNENGEYELTSLADGAYLLKVSFSGYASYTTDRIAMAGNAVAQPEIILKSTTKELKEVAVRAQKQFVEVHADKLVVNVENSIVSAGGSVLDVLSHSPGVNVDQNDNISLKGKPGVNIMINGKIQPVSGAELANMLKSMPSNSVETIELIANPSAKYDAAGTGGIINIKMKKDNKTGLNGTVNANYAQGIYPKGSFGFNMNYRNKKYNFFTSFNHSDRVGFNHLMLDRRFYTGTIPSGGYVQDNHFINYFHTNVGNVGMDYNVSSKTVIGFVLSGDYLPIRSTGLNHSDVIDSVTNATSTHFGTSSEANNYYGNYTANLNLRHNFDSTGKTLSLDVDYAGYTNGGQQDYHTTYTDHDGASIGTPAILHGERWGLTQIASVKGDYTQSLKGNVKLEAGAKSSYVIANNNPRFFNVIGGVNILDVTKTNHFIYNENINAGYFTFSKEWTKWSTQLGLRAEQTIANGNNETADTSFTRNYTNLFPSFAVQRHLNADNDLGVTLSRRIARPSYQQLNPFKYYLDPTTYTEGFPYLQPALSYSAELMHSFKQKFITTLSYIFTSAPLVEVIQPSDVESKVTVQTNKNLTSMSYYGASGSYQFKISKWWNNTTNINAYYANYIGDIAGTYLNNGSFTYDINTINNFIMPKSWSAELSFNYQAPQVYGYMDLRPTWMLNAGVQKNLFDKRATVRLNVTDIFWHGYPSATSYYSNYTEFFVAYRDTRQAAVSFTYRFGKRTLPPSRRHSGGAEDEKSRAGGQGG